MPIEHHDDLGIDNTKPCLVLYRQPNLYHMTQEAASQEGKPLAAASKL